MHASVRSATHLHMYVHLCLYGSVQASINVHIFSHKYLHVYVYGYMRVVWLLMRIFIMLRPRQQHCDQRRTNTLAIC